MCYPGIIEWVANNVSAEEIKGKRVLEIGSCDVNGTVRPTIMAYGPSEYVGIDLHGGPMVDKVLPAEKILECYAPETFDMVICVETLEHVVDWRLVVNNMKAVLKPNGIIIITTPAIGFGFHPYPYDCWRFTAEDYANIFADLEILVLKPEGVFLKARKLANATPRNLEDISIYSMTLQKRTNMIPSMRCLEASP